MHKHAQKMWKIGGAFGKWNYSSVDETVMSQPDSFNLINPPYRDTFTTKFEGTAWIALRYQAVNPGPWMFHRPIEPHMAGGMSTAILDGIDNWLSIPEEYQPDAKGFRPADGLPHGFAWEMRSTVDGDFRAGGEFTQTHDDGIDSTMDSLIKKFFAFLQSLMTRPLDAAEQNRF